MRPAEAGLGMPVGARERSHGRRCAAPFSTVCALVAARAWACCARALACACACEAVKVLHVAASARQRASEKADTTVLECGPGAGQAIRPRSPPMPARSGTPAQSRRCRRRLPPNPFFPHPRRHRLRRPWRGLQRRRRRRGSSRRQQRGGRRRRPVHPRRWHQGEESRLRCRHHQPCQPVRAMVGQEGEE